MTMEKKIKSELTKMSSIMLVLVALGIYAHDFVLAGLQAKLALNLSIFIIAGIAAYIAFAHVRALKNETVALKALQVDFGSIRRRPINPYANPAIVFNEPELLGQGYRMITEELGKQGQVKITNSTVQMLLHDVDQRINDRKSTIMYFSGLMVFLGLLGAFMGLMKTVHSVSDLIGGMDLSGSAGVDGMAKMIEGMKQPLNGMSVGFSSSLFGLMTSMVLGALERCMTSAMKALRNEFEHWLSNLADLEGGSTAVPAGAANELHLTVDADFADMRDALALSNQQLVTLSGAVVETASLSLETRSAMGEMASSIARLTDSVERLHDPKPLLRPIVDTVAELAQNQIAMLSHFRSLYDQAQADRAQIGAMLGGMTAAVDRMNTLDADQLHQQLDSMLVLMSESARARVAPAPTPRAGAWSRLFARLRGVNGLRDVRRELRDMITGNLRATKRIAATIDDRLDRLDASHAADREMLGYLVSHVADQRAVLQTLADQAIVGDGGIADETGLTGARYEMNVLRRRLNAESNDVPDEAPDDPASPAQDRQAGGKGRS